MGKPGSRPTDSASADWMAGVLMTASPTHHTLPLVPTASSQYARYWRWHFYAAWIAIPFIVWQSLTGVLYLWHQELADALWPQLRWSAQAARMPAAVVDLDTQLEAVRAARPDAKLLSVRVESDPARSTLILLDDGNGLPAAAFVDPADGRLLSILPSTTWLPGLTRGLHGGWPLGAPGSWLLELGACWTIVMVLTGLYLWWPRGARGLAGVLYPRLGSGNRRVFWRDLHAVTGFWCAGILLIFLLTALPWTDVWGERVLKPLRAWTGQVTPVPAGIAPAPHHLGSATAASDWPPLAQAVATARQAGLLGALELRAQADRIVVGNQLGRSAGETALHLDRATGAELGRVGWAQQPWVPRWIATGVDLHEGTFFGRANQWFNTSLVVVLLWLVVSGCIGWYRRRPGGGLAAPPRRILSWPSGLRTALVGTCVLLPLLGLSVLLIWVLDRWLVVSRLRPV